MNISITHTSIPDPPDFKKAISLAINETANEAREKAIEVVSGQYNVSRFAIRKTVGITYSTPQKLIAYLRFVGRRMGIIEFDPMQTASGVTAQIELGKNKNYRHAFIRRSKSGKRNVFIRIEAMEYTKEMWRERNRRVRHEGKNYGGPEYHDKHGYPITTVKGISIPDMLNKSSVKAKVIEFIATQLGISIQKYLKT